MSYDMICQHAYMHMQHVSYHTKCLVMMDQSPITIHETGASDLSPWQHIDHNCDVTVMHVRFVSPLSFSVVKNSTEIITDLHPQVNIL